MSIVIYTYSDPYRLKEEPYWDEIKACPYFCAAQTLVNGLKYLYREDFVQGRVTTVRNFLEALFPYWQSTACRIKQHAAIDRWIAECALPTAGAEEQEQMRAALLANRGEVLESIRTMVELGIDAVGSPPNARLQPHSTGSYRHSWRSSIYADHAARD